MSTVPPWEADPGEVNVEPAPKAVEDDYTMGEFWAEVKPAMKAASVERRAKNRTSSAELLQAEGISYTTNNGGVHLIVAHGEQIVDFWPGTGRWRTRTTPIVDRRGVFDLIKYLKGQHA